MFEGKLPGNAAKRTPFDASGGGNGTLRPVSWSDLVARFDAVRELRAEVGSGETGGGASFDPEFARHIAEIGDAKPDINLDDLANGKAADGMARPTTNGAASDDPRT
ncbi:MAG TPA: hypothetical protein VLM18_07475 [Croceibacterium sp.]|nr:hypothetical protein [Croceibacterium sp.]